MALLMSWIFVNHTAFGVDPNSNPASQSGQAAAAHLIGVANFIEASLTLPNPILDISKDPEPKPAHSDLGSFRDSVTHSGRSDSFSDYLDRQVSDLVVTPIQGGEPSGESFQGAYNLPNGM